MYLFSTKYQPSRTFTVAEDGFYGLYFEPESNRFPGKGMVICTGSDGSFSLCRMGAKYFLDAGMPVISLGYFHVPGAPSDPLECPVEYMQNACRWLKEKKGLHPGIWGISLGAEYSLLCGSLCPEIECVIAASPVHVVTQCGSFYGGLHCCMGSPFSWHGKALPYAQGAPTPEAEKIAVKRMKQSFREHGEMNMLFYYEEMLSGPYPEEAGIAVENIHGPVLLISGDEDVMVPAKSDCEAVLQRMQEHGFSYPAVHKNYPFLSHYACPLPGMLGIAVGFAFKVERKHRNECRVSREQMWQDVLEFLRTQWVIG